jgi:hypothetical protein
MVQAIAALTAALLAAAIAGGCAEAQSGPVHRLGSAASPTSVNAGDDARPDKFRKIRVGELSATPSGYYAMCVG